MFAHCLDFEAGTRRATDGQRARAWLLLIAILPMLTFLGHWPDMRVGIPGTTAWLTIPLSGGEHAHSHGAASEPSDDTLFGASVTHADLGDESDDAHGRHCHTDAASCTDAPFTGVSAFALLSGSVALLGAGDLPTLLVHQLWEPTRDLTPGPEIQPPRP